MGVEAPRLAPGQMREVDVRRTADERYDGIQARMVRVVIGQMGGIRCPMCRAHGDPERVLIPIEGRGMKCLHCGWNLVMTGHGGDWRDAETEDGDRGGEGTT